MDVGPVQLLEQQQRHAGIVGLDHRRVLGAARIALALGRIYPFPNHVRSVLTVLYALRLDPVRRRAIRASAVSRLPLWRDGKKVSSESDDFQCLGGAVLDFRSAEGGDQHELRERRTQ